jgi:hypothetical protein
MQFLWKYDSYIRDSQIFPKIQEAAPKSRRQNGYTKLDQYRRSTDIGRRRKIFSRHDDLSYGILYFSQNIFRLKKSGLPQYKRGHKRGMRQVRCYCNNTVRKCEGKKRWTDTVTRLPIGQQMNRRSILNTETFSPAIPDRLWSSLNLLLRM